jgi:peptidoglycan/LPS O-acetylase OafA/YrhL
MKTELSALTGARGLAAWFVVLYHLRGAMTLPDGILAVLAKGYLAVDFFFLLSGFVIWITYVERIRLARWQAVPTFLLRRVARIWPLHLTMLAFAVAIAVALRLTGHPRDPRFPFSQLPAHILLLQNWPIVVQRFGITSLDWNDPAWSISSEIFAYLLFPLIVMAVDWRRVPTVVLLAVIAATIALLSHVMTSRDVHHLGDAIPYFGQVRCITEFVCGTVTGALWLRYRDRPRVPIIASAAVAIVAFAAFGTGACGEIASIPVALAGVLLLLALTSGIAHNPLGGRILHYLGEISFATYLSHSLLWKAFRLAFVRTTGPESPIMLALFLALVLGTSILLYHLLERPAQTWLNRLPRRRSGSADVQGH